MGHGVTNPTLTKKSGKSNKFRIILLKQNAYFPDNIVWVAIQKVGKKKKYLSCRRKSLANMRQCALAEWRGKIGEFETFQMMLIPHDNSVVFQSHNGLYLSVNETFYTCEFKTCSSKDEYGFPLKGRWEILGCAGRGGMRIGERNTAGVMTRNLFRVIPSDMFMVDLGLFFTGFFMKKLTS